ncbi:NADH-quinone oxidoreductase subunit K [Hydrogenophaga sp. NFH-34]|uniref:NADH-quinone oxidoreductase subunit K n=1 Tax=Hydrogenophaga sp. NFH-34 TaxID=2744446 RepID=UPI001F2D62AA|nr:NADH-quinone oxidoreductase subunit K [Hydrogenophaga sp. NFH-34]
METLYALTFGAMLAAALYLLMSRNLLRMVLGLLLMGNAVNLAIFTGGRLSSAVPPLVPEGARDLVVSANPLPQALILTAIVISFSLVAYAVVLFERSHRALGTLDPDAMGAAEPEAAPTGHPARAEERA